MSDERDRPDNNKDDPSLDNTIDRLESAIAERQQQLSELRSVDHPPAGAVVPVLTRKIATLAALPANAAATPLETPSQAGVAKQDLAELVEGITNGVNTSLSETLNDFKQQIINDLRHDITQEIVLGISQEVVNNPSAAPAAEFSGSATAEAVEPNTAASNAPPTRHTTRGTDTTAMDKTYDPHALESDRYRFWESKGYFRAHGSGDPYCIMLPPPNVTGSLHMGHAFQDTLMDGLIRYKRMSGKRALWQCGTDHAGIATQMVVERQLAQNDVKRTDIGREKFVEEVWRWKHESGGKITQQLRRMGASMDWSRERFTLDDELSRAVTEVFVRLYDEGLIYRGKRLVNWDPVLHTAISDLEVVSEEENGSLWHIRYPLSDGTGYVVVATTRPETMLGDTAVAVHPDDDRYRRIIGKTIALPLSDRHIPVIADDYVDPEFGSGCLKITPAHDFNDYEVAKSHDLPLINIFTDNAAINDNAPEKYRGLDRYDARKQVVADLEAGSLLVRVDDHKLMVPRGDRSQAVVEPYLTDQWFVQIEPLAKPAIEAVENGSIRFVPENWSKTYFEWMRNIEDWCISRQLWWGHRIPAWYDEQGNIYVGKDESDVRTRNGLADDVALRQDPDVLDTWFSSALWPFSTLGWPDETPELATYYPTSVLVTGFDIIFFWVARMIMMGLKFMGDVPFREVYIHGLVRDADGNKMSKSKGNILDPLDLIDGIELEPLIGKRTTGLMRPEEAPKIEAATRKHFADGIPSYGTDALRFTFASMATQGRDIKFDLGRVAGYRNFCNKIWNAARFVMLMCDGHDLTQSPQTATPGLPEKWIRSRLTGHLEQIRQGFDTYRFDLAAQSLYEFIWDEYCDWYIELAKIDLNNETLSADHHLAVRITLVNVLECSLRALHPLMPFITDEIWLRVAPLLGKGGQTIMLQPYPGVIQEDLNPSAEADFEWLRSFILGVRRVRAEYDIAPSREIPVLVKDGTSNEQRCFAENQAYIQRLTRTTDITRIDTEFDGEAATELAGETTILVPMSDLIDRDAEIARLGKELERLEREQQKAANKVSNPAFVEKAPPDIVAKERQKLQEIVDNISRIKAQLAKFGD